MKSLLTVIFLFTISGAYACPDISRNYLCEEAAEHPDRLGTRNLEFSFDSAKNSYLMKTGLGAIAFFTLDQWNQMYDPTTWNPTPGAETRAECYAEVNQV